MIDTEREREAETLEEGEAGFMQEPNVRLNPRSPGSGPGLQAALNHCATGAAQIFEFFNQLKHLLLITRPGKMSLSFVRRCLTIMG